MEFFVKRVFQKLFFIFQFSFKSFVIVILHVVVFFFFIFMGISYTLINFILKEVFEPCIFNILLPIINKHHMNEFDTDGINL